MPWVAFAKQRRFVDNAPSGPGAKAWDALHLVADKGYGRLNPITLKILLEAGDGIDVKALIEALSAEDFAGAEAIMEGAIDTMVDTLAEEIGPILEETAMQGAQASVEGLPIPVTEQDLEAVFGRINRASVHYAQTRGAQLVVDINSTTRKTIQETITRAVQDGASPFDTRKDLESFIGLTDKQANGVVKYRDALRQSGRAEREIAKLVARRIEQAKRMRAENIARTETLDAANEGQQQLWKEAESQGIVPTYARRFWIISPDERLCKICAPIPRLNQHGVGLSEPFQTPAGQKMRPTAHPQCRCTLSIRVQAPFVTPSPPPPPLPPSTELPSLDTIEAIDVLREALDPPEDQPGIHLYRGRDRKRRVFQRRDDPLQAYTEAVANRIYRALDIDAPESTLVVEDGTLLGIATEFIPKSQSLKEKGLTAKRAEELLDGLVADVWLSNRDALGFGLENIRVKGKRIVREKNAGALKHRAQGGKKPEEELAKLLEWEGFSDSNINPHYAKIFEAAGIDSADDLGIKGLQQIEKILQLRDNTRNFADLLPDAPGVGRDEKAEILQLLRHRAQLLEGEIIPRLRDAIENAPRRHRETQMRKLLKADMDRLSQRGRELMERYGKDDRGMTDAEIAAVHAYTTEDPKWSYRKTNQALQRQDEKSLKRLRPLIETTIEGLKKLPQYEEGKPLYRGTTFPRQVDHEHQVGSRVKYSAFTSTSDDPSKAFGGSHRVTILSAGGARNVQALSPYRESEWLYPPDTVFEVIERREQAGVVYLLLQEVVERQKMQRQDSAQKASILDAFIVSQEAATESINPHIQRHMNSGVGLSPLDAPSAWERILRENT